MSTFYDLLCWGRPFKCSVYVDDTLLDVPLVWNTDIKIGPVAYRYYEYLMRAPARYDSQRDIIYIKFCYGPQMPLEFLNAILYRNMPEKEFNIWFPQKNQLAACDCEHCNRAKCSCRNKVARFPSEVHGMNMCELLYA